MNILDKANQIVNYRAEEKERQYGPFKESIERACSIYNLMSSIGEQIKPESFYKVLIALKLSREAYSHKEDNLLDACAYIGALNNYYLSKTDKENLKKEVKDSFNLDLKTDFLEAFSTFLKYYISKTYKSLTLIYRPSINQFLIFRDSWPLEKEDIKLIAIKEKIIDIQNLYLSQLELPTISLEFFKLN